MGKDSPSAPTPIDPTAVINAQANANRVNQVGPSGSSTWSKGANGQWKQTTGLSPTQQGLYDQSNILSKDALAGLKLQPANFQYGATLPSLQTSVANPGVPVTSLGSAGPVQRGVNSTPLQNNLNLSGVQGIPQADNAAYNKAVNSVYGQAQSRLDPQWQQQQTQLETQLANQGIPQNSAAWNKAMTQFTQGKNDAYTSAFNNAVTQGSQVEGNLFNMGLQANQAGVGNALASGNFANQAQAQGFGEGLSNANLNNAAQNQQYQQMLQSGQFANSAAGQQLAQALATAGFGNAAKQQTFTDSLQNAGLNNSATQQRIATLMSEAGMPSQFSSPSLPGSGPGVDALGAYSLNAQQQLAQYQSQVAQNSAKKGGLGSLAGSLGSAAILSDRRVKRDIKRVGRTENGFPIYSYRYAWDDKPQIGLMAQDVEKRAPHAVITSGGIKHVDYAKALAA